MALNIVVCKESDGAERRVAIAPSQAEKLLAAGHQLSLEKGAGEQANAPDSSYPERVVKKALPLKRAAVMLSLHMPLPKQLEEIKSGAIIIGGLFPERHPDAVAVLKKRKLTAFAIERIPRISRAQTMDILSSQATIAGYHAVLEGALHANLLFPMLTTAAGTIKPANVLVIGAGVAGLQAIATARRLGARVSAYDIRPAAREQVESLGAKMIDTGINAESSGGYARALSKEEQQQQADALTRHLANSDVVISTAAVPGRPAPRIISAAMVRAMRPGAVIVDAAAESGGNCALTQPGKILRKDHRTISGPLNLASRSAANASEMYGRNLIAFLDLLLSEGELKLDWDDPILSSCRISHDKKTYL